MSINVGDCLAPFVQPRDYLVLIRGQHLIDATGLGAST